MRRTLVLLLVAATLTACAATDVADDNVASRDPGGCDQQVAPIRLDPAFTPYDQRLTHSIAEDDATLSPFSPGGRGSADPRLPAELGTVPAWGSVAEGGTTTQAYGGDRTVREPWQVLRSGGVLVSVWSGTPGHSLARALAEDAPAEGGLPQVALVPVGPYDAAVSWADPEPHGLREHNVIWTSDDGTDHRISGVRAPEQLVALARSWVCGDGGSP